MCINSSECKKERKKKEILPTRETALLSIVAAGLSDWKQTFLLMNVAAGKKEKKKYKDQAHHAL